ncbi:MAG: Uma2 family endonuclease [Roseofilum sp. SBFL]|uniref:Uma2 family endonuclease n=1 Tax=unclassified Roseofilum TaxID=2620099 RepID=UPI001B2CE21A|nr:MULTISPECIES: Uma2 family endonuclease [unclassified Roseofilum]MBP0014899.1 Uma2 family endonuclease [Roseofilum sp. SID3]MBP0024230.1 Uma2 family endonuclease [Roseofilum sp. SID2]MBP0036556.1 Uma2 family endonuclease [Roseofilum sp. SID1]MBP0041285.1 Uma2 family endonuclease [Roseofilum sp. SBFL]
MTIIAPEIVHFSVQEYHQMIESGIFKERRVELINGLIIEMSPQGTEHAYFEENLAKKLERLTAGRAYVREAKPITLSTSEPEPDIVVAKLPRSQYIDHHPFPQDIELVVEVSKATQSYDMSAKKALYAQENIPEYWIVDINSRTVMVYRFPQGNDYRDRKVFSVTEEVFPLAFPDLLIPVSDIFTI